MGTSIQNLSYGWDVAGNLTARADWKNAVGESMTYDQLNRVSTSAVGSTTINYGYDASGNLTTKSDLNPGTYKYPTPGTGSVQPHAVSSITGTVDNGHAQTTNPTYTYDANGNMTGGGGRSFAYTSFNMPSCIAAATSCVAGSSYTETFTYDADHQRVEQVSPAGTKIYVNAGGVLTEQFTDGSGNVTWTSYVSAGGSNIATYSQGYSGTGFTYLHTDHLGSTTATTGPTGSLLSPQVAYDVWGKLRNTNGTADPTDLLSSPTTYGYTGQEQLSSTALIHMNGRVYDPQIGRFTSADPLVATPYLTQGWNRYAYVYNNPLARTDPTGFDGDDDDDDDDDSGSSSSPGSGAPPAATGSPGGGQTLTTDAAPDTTTQTSDQTNDTGGASLIFAGGSVPSYLMPTVGGYDNLTASPDYSTGSGPYVGTASGAGLTGDGWSVSASSDQPGGFWPMYQAAMAAPGAHAGDAIDTYYRQYVPSYGCVRDGCSAGGWAWAAVTSVPWGKTLDAGGEILGSVGKGASAELSELFEPILNGCGCFVAGTPVETDRGLVPIEQVKLGDRVRSRDEATGATSFRRVTALIRPQGREVYEVRLHLSGSRLDETFDVTGDHPWKSKDGHWLTTLQLAKGARLETEHGRSANVLWVTDTGHTAPTYNLEVEGTHTFFVGKEHVWVHNACPLAGWAINEVHHLLPWQFESEFLSRGLNPDNFTVTLPRALHRLVPWGVHTGDFASTWNGHWDAFFRQYPTANAQDILAQLARMRVHFRI